MSEFYAFAGEHPILTVVLMCIVSSTLVGMAYGIGGSGRRRR